MTTKLEQAARQILEAVEGIGFVSDYWDEKITALREALGYCIDEGCPHRETTHTCINPIAEQAEQEHTPYCKQAPMCDKPCGDTSCLQHVDALRQEPVADVFKFLLGGGELEGCGFGDKPDNERGNFWWRKHLRKALEQTTAKDSLTVQSSDHSADAGNMVCSWHQDDDDGTWATDCGGIFVIIEGTPSDNKMKFCAYCGKPLVEHPFVDSEDEQ